MGFLQKQGTHSEEAGLGTEVSGLKAPCLHPAHSFAVNVGESGGIVLSQPPCPAGSFGETTLPQRRAGILGRPIRHSARPAKHPLWTCRQQPRHATSRVIVPQYLARSILHRSVNSVGTIQMPPLAKNHVDTAGADALLN